MELKFKSEFVEYVDEVVLIVPLWNWNYEMKDYEKFDIMF